LNKALRNEFHLADGNKIQLYQVILITSKDVTADARKYIMDNMDAANIIDGITIAELASKQNLKFY
jgi:hypothetical protein